MRKRLFAVGIGIGVVLAMPSAASAKTIHVHQGQSIQRAVNRAHHGDTIKVSAGTFRGGVAIKKDNLTLTGAGPIRRSGTLIHPGRKSNRKCRGSGFCIFPGTRGTHVKRFLFRGFKDFGAVAQGAKDTVFFRDHFVNNGEYGVAAFGSHGTQILHGIAKGAGEAGFYIGVSKHANAVLKNDTAKSNGAFGFFLRDSSHGRVTDSEAKDNCLGLGLINTGESGGVRGWAVRDSDFLHNNRNCPPEEGAPPISGTGIALLGAKRNVIHGNAALDNRPTSSAPFAGGIVLFSSKPLGGTVSAHNVIKRNDAHDNLPADIRWDGKGKGNKFRRNHCDTSQPSGLCH